MASLFVILITGLILAVFAIQNNAAVTMHYGGYTLPNIPLYAVVIGSMLVGIALSWILSLFGWASTSMRLMGKDKAIRQYSDATQRLENRVSQLEAENEKLREDKQIIKEERDDATHESLSEKIRHTFS
jgi:uncharacterized integral membrane protein